MYQNLQNHETKRFCCKPRFRYSFICQGTLIRRQRRDHFGLLVKLY